MTRDSKWRARHMHRLDHARAYWLLVRLVPRLARVLVDACRVAARRTRWTLFGHSGQVRIRAQTPLLASSRGKERDHLAGLGEASPQAGLADLFLCMACGRRVHSGSPFVETRSGLRRHVTCPAASTWGDARLDALWEDIQQAGSDSGGAA